MPIFEYKCRACEHEYEALVLDAKTPPCPKCESQDIERRLSLFAASIDGDVSRLVPQRREHEHRPLPRVGVEPPHPPRVAQRHPHHVVRADVDVVGAGIRNWHLNAV